MHALLDFYAGWWVISKIGFWLAMLNIVINLLRVGVALLAWRVTGTPDLTPYARTDAEAAAEDAEAYAADDAQDAALDAELARLPAVTWTEEDAAEAERRALARQERGGR